MKTTKILFALLAVCVIIGIYVFRDALPFGAGRALGPETTRSLGDHAPPTATSNEALPAASRTERLDVESVDFADLQRRSEAGDSSASRQLAEAYDECWLFANDPIVFERDIQSRIDLTPEYGAGFRTALAYISQRCSQLVGTKGGPALVMETFRKAAKQGDLAAQIRVLSSNAARNGNTLTPELRHELAARAVRTADASAFMAIADLLGPAAEGMEDALKPYPAGGVPSEAAWTLAACRLGRACSGYSPTAISMCLGAGINCKLHSVEQFYLQEMLPPAEHAKLRQQVEYLLQLGKTP